MRSLVLVVLFFLLATATGVLRSAASDASAAAAASTAELAPGTLGNAALTAVVQEGPKVTVRVGNGRSGVNIGGNNQGNGRRGRVNNPGLVRNPNRAGASMLTVDDQTVSMADQGTSGEGILTRIHVDADDGLTAVIGFYSTIDGDQPVNNPNTYSCKKCGGVLVCSVDPQCVN
ncbi:MAG: hypothetical protein WBO43_10620 [Gemmatimonadota bacterium]|jgi:hypothetical protein